MGIRLKYSKNYLLKYLRQFYDENGKIPEARDFNKNPKYPSFGTYQKYFGSWNNVIRITGLIPCKCKTDEELLDFIKQFYDENSRVPIAEDFNKNHKYPSFGTYINRFGSWNNALKLVGLDIDSMINKGIIDTTSQKGRFWELKILNYLGKEAIDLSGKNCISSYDGIFRNQKYDAKSSKLHERFWTYSFQNKEKSDWYYLGAFNKDYSKLLHVWRIPKDFIDDTYIDIGIENKFRYNIENMKKYTINAKEIEI